MLQFIYKWSNFPGSSKETALLLNLFQDINLDAVLTLSLPAGSHQIFIASNQTNRRELEAVMMTGGIGLQASGLASERFIAVFLFRTRGVPASCWVIVRPELCKGTVFSDAVKNKTENSNQEEYKWYAIWMRLCYIPDSNFSAGYFIGNLPRSMDLLRKPLWRWYIRIISYSVWSFSCCSFFWKRIFLSPVRRQIGSWWFIMQVWIWPLWCSWCVEWLRY